MKRMKKWMTLLLVLTALCVLAVPAFAAGDELSEEAAVEEFVSENDVKSAKTYATAVLMGLSAIGGTIGMAYTIAKSSESIARQPEAAGQIRTAMMLGLVFIETVVIYALIVAILIVFVL